MGTMVRSPGTSVNDFAVCICDVLVIFNAVTVLPMRA